MKRILKRPTKTSKREIPAAAGGASVNAARRTASRVPLQLTAGGASVPASRAPLQLAIAIRRKSQTDLSDLNNLLADKSTRQNALEKTGNLHDKTVIAEIGTLQIFTRILPQRIAAKEADDATVEQTLIKATNDFIHQHLGPRIRKLAAQTREQAETELSPHFQDRAALLRAIAQSQQVRTIDVLAWTATSQPAHGAIAHAEGALKAWAAADEFQNSEKAKQDTLPQG
jgi:hypothetical protein